MATITTLATADNGATSRTTINDNFTNLNTDKIETSVLSTDGTLAGDSDTEIPSVKAVKTYVNAQFGITTAISTSATPSVTTTAGQALTIVAKGTYSNCSGDVNVTVQMLVNAVVVDACRLDLENSSTGAASGTVTFLYHATPGARANDITFSQTLSNLQVLTTITE